MRFPLLYAVSLAFLFFEVGRGGLAAQTPELEGSKQKWMDELDTSDLSAQQKKRLERDEKRELEKRKFDAKTPIEFFAKIMDEGGNPVSKVQVEILVNDDSESGTTTYRRTSNANGQFSLKGVTGKNFSVIIAHPNYYASRKNPSSFEVADKEEKDFYEADIKKPVVFVMQKRGLSEPLIKERLVLKLPVTGEPIARDLVSRVPVVNGNNSESTDLIASLQTTRVGDRGEVTWNLTLEIPGNSGGIVITHDEFMFTAPKSGYQKKVVLDSKDFQEAGGSKNGSVYFYLCSREGKNFARVKISLAVTGSTALIGNPPKRVEVGELSCSYFLNPNGSTNLEYGVGNLIGVKGSLHGIYQLIFPSQEQIIEAKREYYDGDYDPIKDQMLNRRDFFP